MPFDFGGITEAKYESSTLHSAGITFSIVHGACKITKYSNTNFLLLIKLLLPQSSYEQIVVYSHMLKHLETISHLERGRQERKFPRFRM